MNDEPSGEYGIRVGEVPGRDSELDGRLVTGEPR